jgi:hypothetical protein
VSGFVVEGERGEMVELRFAHVKRAPRDGEINRARHDEGNEREYHEPVVKYQAAEHDGVLFIAHGTHGIHGNGSNFTFPFFASFVSFAVDFLVRLFNH